MEERNMEMKIVGITVAILVSITLLAGVLMPVLDDATATTDTFTNEGYYRMSELAPADDAPYTISWVKTNPFVFTINSVDYNMQDILTTTNQYFTVLASDGAYLRVANNGNALIIQMQNYEGNPIIAADTSTTTMKSFDISVDSDSMDATRVTGEDQTVSVSTSYSDWCYGFDPAGKYIMKLNSSSAYVVDEDIIILAGVTKVGTTEVAVYGFGNVDEISLESVYPDDDTTYSDVEINSTVVSDYLKLNKISTVTFDMTRSGTTAHATYSYFLVPYEVTAEREVHFTDNENALFAVIPMLVIVAILIGVVALVIRSRLD